MKHNYSNSLARLCKIQVDSLIWYIEPRLNSGPQSRDRITVKFQLPGKYHLTLELYIIFNIIVSFTVILTKKTNYCQISTSR